MSTSVTPGWCVRFLSGSLRGRTIALKLGANVVGSAGDCDIMLPGDVLPRHMTFTVGDIIVSIRKFGTAAVKLNGAELSLQRRSAVRGDIISLGGIDFELDRLNADDSVSLARAAEREVEKVADVPPAVVTPPVIPVPTSPPRHRAGVVMMATAVAAITVVVGFGLSPWSQPKARAYAGSASAAEVAELQEALAAFPDVKISAEKSDGTASVKGYVTSAPRKVAILRALEPFGDRVYADIHVTDEIVERARSFLNEPGLAVTYTGRGRIIVSGSVENELVRQKITRLSQGLLPAVAVIDKVQYGRGGDDPTAGQAELAEWKRTLPSRMVGLTEYTNGLRQIQLANGQRYYEGATLKSGELVNIEADRLVVTNNAAAQTSMADSRATKPPE